MNTKDGLHLSDNATIYSKNSDKHDMGMRGHVVFRDPLTNEILFEKDNLITQRSRAYILELISGMSSGVSEFVDNETKVDENGETWQKVRTLCLFKIGNGGADIQNTPFESISPNFNDTDLFNPVPFIIYDPMKSLSDSKKANPSYVEEMYDEDKNTYYLPFEQADNSVRYYGKKFDSMNSKLFVNRANGECYLKFNLELNVHEARGQLFNELGLLIGRYDPSDNTYKDVELFSHITFDTNSLKSLKRDLVIEYYIYA